MKPKEQNRKSQEQARGLARWGWIKRYLKPALDYMGITSDDFDRVFIGGDQHIKSQERTDLSPFPTPLLAISPGAVYEPTGDTPGEETTSDGYWYLEWQWTPDTAVLEPDGDPLPIYGWGGDFTMVTPPRYDFKFALAAQGSNTVDPYVDNSGTTDWARILLAKRIDGVVTSFSDGTLINVQLKGLWNVTPHIV